MPERDSRALWEKLILDGFQAGLSWITILKKREAFREAFHDFDPHQVARYGEADIERLLANADIVRSRAKIEAAIGSARAYLDMQQKGEEFSPFIWSFVDDKVIHNRWTSVKDTPTQTPQSEALSKALKARGFKFVGPVIVYAFMQATGLVNDHAAHCFRWEEVRQMSQA